MDFFQNIKNNSLLIVPSNIKRKLLEYIDSNNILKSVKLLSFNDLKKGLLFDFNNETIYYIMKKYHVNYGVALEYINNLYYLEDKIYENEKYKYLVSIKEDLVKNNLLIYDKLFLNLIKSYDNLYVYGFDYIKKFDNYLLDKIKELINIEIINKEYKEYNHHVYEFKTMNEEISFVFESILDLVKDGIDLNNIYIVNYSSPYYFTFKSLSKMFNLPVYLKNDTSLYQTVIGKYLLDNLDNNLDKLLYKIKIKFDYDYNIYNANLINKIQNMLNNYYWCDDIKSIKELIEEELKNNYINGNHFEHEISLTNLTNNDISDEEYVFLIGFNLGNIPKLKRDEDFLNDDIKPEFIETTNEYNDYIKSATLKAIKNIKNLTITYKLTDHFNSYLPSFLTDECLDVIKKDDFISKYTNEFNEINLAKKCDNLIKFNEYDKKLEILYNNYKIPYKEYDNSFTNIDNDLLIERINDKINFSYSNISKYYECPFKFYLSDILKINEYEERLDQFIGNIFHHVLEKCLDTNLDIDETYDNYVLEHKDEIEFNNKAKFFIDLLKTEIHFVIETIRCQYKHSKHTKVKCEEKIEIDVKRKIKTKLKGYIDKLLILNNSVLIVDYKTNDKTVEKKFFEFGVGIQLPIYLYLLKQIDDDIEVAGMYLQHILSLNEEFSINKDYLEEKKKRLKLDGITFDNITLLSKFDDTYEKSDIIKSVSLKDGKLRKTKNVFNEEEKEELIELIENLIFNMIDNVSDGCFQINPLKIDKPYFDACQYCDYKDICYRKFKDYNIQKTKDVSGDEE